MSPRSLVVPMNMVKFMESHTRCSHDLPCRSNVAALKRRTRSARPTGAMAEVRKDFIGQDYPEGHRI
jgi:hypothetical protein